MRATLLSLLAPITLVAASPAVAASPLVEVKIGPKLHEEAVQHLGVKEVDRLAADLKRHVERELGRTGALDGARVELTLVDAEPNRPTFRQLTDRPGLSYESFGVGGAKIEGKATAADGTITPIRYQWYESDIRYARDRVTWADADSAFGQFARRLAHGEAYALR